MRWKFIEAIYKSNLLVPTDSWWTEEAEFVYKSVIFYDVRSIFMSLN